jgi:pantothenate kinase
VQVTSAEDGAGWLSFFRDLTARGLSGFERTLEQPIAASIPVPTAARLIITEGNYLLLPDDEWPQIRALINEVWYVDLDDPERLKRLINRHVKFGKSADAARAWVQGPDQANAQVVASTRHRADLLIRLSDLDPPPVTGNI